MLAVSLPLCRVHGLTENWHILSDQVEEVFVKPLLLLNSVTSSCSTIQRTATVTYSTPAGKPRKTRYGNHTKPDDATVRIRVITFPFPKCRALRPRSIETCKHTNKHTHARTDTCMHAHTPPPTHTFAMYCYESDMN